MSFVTFVVDEFLSHVVSIDSTEFPQQLLRSLVENPWQHKPDFNDKIATPSISGRRDAPLAQPEPLAGLGARRHADTRLALE